jgi:cytosine/adenosine deaminase-related metal-dependent hydrolase
MKRFLTAKVIFPVEQPPISNGILVLDPNGIVLDVIDPSVRSEEADQLQDSSAVEKFAGILVPGFINAHCHLELSHLRGKIEEKTGLPDFLKNVSQLRATDDGEIEAAMLAADREMYEEGIVGVGDISNRDVSIAIKKASRLRYHTFVEAFDLHPDYAEARFAEAERIQTAFTAEGLSASVVPHAPYTVSEKLLQLIVGSNNNLLSIHHQETKSELEMFRSSSGSLLEFLKGTGKYNEWSSSGSSSLEYILNNTQSEQRTLLVHNTYADRLDFDKAESNKTDLWWCLCPQANLYIENRLPDVSVMLERKLKLLLGTDSLSSNNRLSILDEMKVLLSQVPSLNFDQLLESATLLPARFFGWESSLGSFSPGKQPGVNFIFGDIDTFRMLNEEGVLLNIGLQKVI